MLLEPLLFKTTQAENGTASLVPEKVDRCVETLTKTKTSKKHLPRLHKMWKQLTENQKTQILKKKLSFIFQ